jgi:hypothetical protein
MSFKSAIKSILADSNESNYLPTQVGGRIINLSYHDRCHIEISKLNPILIGKDLVNGINGVPIKEFGREGEQSLYSPYLDEARVGIHQWCKQPTKLVAIARLAYWLLWLHQHKVNPIKVLIAHMQSM